MSRRPIIQRKRANLGGLRTFTKSHVLSPGSKSCTRISSFLNPKGTLEGIHPSPWLELKQSTWAIGQFPPGPYGRMMISVHRGWADPGFPGESVPDMGVILGLVKSLAVKTVSQHSFSQGQWMSQAVEWLLPQTLTRAYIKTQNPLKCTCLPTLLEGFVGYSLCLALEEDWI